MNIRWNQRQLMFLLVSLVWIAGCGSAGNVPTSGLSPTPRLKAEPAVMGANVAAFTAKYGKPNDDSWPEAGAFSFGPDLGEGIYSIDITSKNKQVRAIRVHSKSSKLWGLKEAETICRNFLPADAYKTEREHVARNLNNQIFRIDNFWVSPILGTQFPASDFTDSRSDLMTPGTVDMQYNTLLDDLDKVMWCDLDLGIPAYAE